MPSVGDAITQAINKIAEAIWGFADKVLGGAFTIIDGHAQPELLYTKAGPLGTVYPITVWIGLVLVLGLAFAQAGRVAWRGGEGIGEAARGLGLYALVTAVGLALINSLTSAAGHVADGIIKAGFDVNNFQGLAHNSTFMAGAVKSLTGMSLGLMSILLVIPFGFGLIIEVLIREGSLLVLAATYPIICAGLVHEKFARWYWTGLRWMLALICMTPVIAIAMVIGHGIAQGAGSGKGDSSLDAIGMAMVSGVACMISLTAPLVLFKLFAFVDPNTPSGQTARGLVGGFGGGSAAADGSAGGGASGNAEGQAGQPGSTTPGGDAADAGELDGGQGPQASDEVSGTQAGVMAAVAGPLGGALGGAGSQANSAANGAAAHSAATLDAVGAGHQGGPAGENDDGDDDSQRQPERHDDASDSPQDAPVQGPPPGDSNGPGTENAGGAPTVDLDKADPAAQTPFGDDPPDADGGGPGGGSAPGGSGGSGGSGGGKPPVGPGGPGGAGGAAEGGAAAGGTEAAAVAAV